MTLVEVMVGSMVMAIVIGMFTPIMVRSLRTTGDVEVNGRNMDQIRIALQGIARELRSGDCIREPTIPSGGTQSAASPTLVFESTAQAKATGGTAYWLRYRVVAATSTRPSQLLREELASTTTGFGKLVPSVDSGGNYVVSASRQLAESVVATGDYFTHVATPRRSVLLKFSIQTSGTRAPRVVTSTVAARNAWRESQC